MTRLFKKAAAIFLAAVTLISAAPAAYAAKQVGDDIVIVIDDKLFETDIQMTMTDAYILVPLEDICKQLGYQVYWRNDTNTIDVVKSNEFITVKPGSRKVIANGEEVMLETYVRLVDNNTAMVSLRFVTRCLNKNISYSETFKDGYKYIWISDDIVIDGEKEIAAVEKKGNYRKLNAGAAKARYSYQLQKDGQTANYAMIGDSYENFLNRYNLKNMHFSGDKLTLWFYYKPGDRENAGKMEVTFKDGFVTDIIVRP